MKVRMWLRRVVGPLVVLTLAAGVGAAPAEAVVISAFEGGSVAADGWTVIGDGTADTPSSHAGDWTSAKNNSTGPLLNQDYLPIAGTGMGRIAPTGTLQTMTIEKAITLAIGDTLQGWSAFDDRECKPIDGSNCFNDTASVDIIQGSTTITLWYRDSLTTPVSGTLTNPSDLQCDEFFHPAFPFGANGCGDDPWSQWSWASVLTGGAMLRFSVTNGTDNGKDSYALIDQVELTSAGGPAVPMPAGLLLMVAGITLGGLVRRRRSV